MQNEYSSDHTLNLFPAQASLNNLKSFVVFNFNLFCQIETSSFPTAKDLKDLAIDGERPEDAHTRT